MKKKQKAIIVPISFVGQKPRLLVVKDKRHGDWTFVTGGCKQREYDKPILAAIRELEEETRGVVDLKECIYSYYSFKHRVKDTEESTYHVYLVDMSVTRAQQDNMISEFNRLMRTTTMKRAYEENDGIAWLTMAELRTKKVWSLIRHNVINPGSLFYALMYSQNRTFYSMPEEVEAEDGKE
jgi:8-oxo-dGTP pyrophosphatase MutT (NUDIX family)